MGLDRETGMGQEGGKEMELVQRSHNHIIATPRWGARGALHTPRRALRGALSRSPPDSPPMPHFRGGNGEANPVAPAPRGRRPGDSSA